MSRWADPEARAEEERVADLRALDEAWRAYWTAAVGGHVDTSRKREALLAVRRRVFDLEHPG